MPLTREAAEFLIDALRIIAYQVAWFPYAQGEQILLHRRANPRDVSQFFYLVSCHRFACFPKRPVLVKTRRSASGVSLYFTDTYISFFIKILVLSLPVSVHPRC